MQVPCSLRKGTLPPAVPWRNPKPLGSAIKICISPASGAFLRPGGFCARAASVAVVAPTKSADTTLGKTLTESAAPGQDLEALAEAAGVQKEVRCGPTPLGRGLLATRALGPQTIVSVPLHNALVITDQPLSGISVFGDRCLAEWQRQHATLPQQLQDFVTGDARWDVRMTALLLWLAAWVAGRGGERGRRQQQPLTQQEQQQEEKQEGRGSGSSSRQLWRAYLASLPPPEEVTCLINYAPEEAKELQIKELMEEAEAQYTWAVSVHRKYFDSERGELRDLRLAPTLYDTLWAMSMVRTRTFSEEVDGEELTLMVPYADLANHSFRHNATFCMAPCRTRFQLCLLAPLEADQEATISYGEGKPNPEVMRDYGFVVPGNPNDRLLLPDQATLPPLNGAALLQSIGFKGDWREGQAAPTRPTLEAAEGDTEARLQLARRRCAVLSMNLASGFGSAADVQPGQQQQQPTTVATATTSTTRNNGDNGSSGASWPPLMNILVNLFGNMLPQTKSRTSAMTTSDGTSSSVPSVASSGSLASSSPSTLSASTSVSVSASVDDHGELSLASTTAAAAASVETQKQLPLLPAAAAAAAAELAKERSHVTTVRQRYQRALDELPTSIEEDQAVLLQPVLQPVASRPMGQRRSNLHAAAVRCRLEHKLLLREAVRVLDVYEKWLVKRQQQQQQQALAQQL